MVRGPTGNGFLLAFAVPTMKSSRDKGGDIGIQFVNKLILGQLGIASFERVAKNLLSIAPITYLNQSAGFLAVWHGRPV